MTAFCNDRSPNVFCFGDQENTFFHTGIQPIMLASQVSGWKRNFIKRIGIYFLMGLRFSLCILFGEGVSKICAWSHVNY